jgi:putative phosphoesterase
MRTIGIISDTHKLVRPQALEFLRNTDLIIHAGDIGSPEVIEQLQELAPVKAVRGNIDKAAWADAFPPYEVVQVAGKTIYVLHDVNELTLDPAASGFDVVVSGHSHMPKVSRHNHVLYINPGSAGPRRFKLPVAVASLKISNGKLTAKIEELSI